MEVRWNELDVETAAAGQHNINFFLLMAWNPEFIIIQFADDKL